MSTLPLKPEPPPIAPGLMTRKKFDATMTWSTRRQNGAIVMAIVAILALLRLRSTYESSTYLLGDAILHALLALAGYLLVHGLPKRVGIRRSSEAKLGQPNSPQKTPFKTSNQAVPGWKAPLAASMIILYPWVSSRFLLSWDQPVGNEIVMMGSLAWGALSMAMFATSFRTLGLSVVASGFLTLFTTFISDHTSAIFIAFFWGILCLWWLVANRWECMDSQQAFSVRRTAFQRFGSVTFGSLLFLVAALAIAGRFSVIAKLETELTPTSGGTGQQSGSARSGVGNGDALVAAQKHAVTFGAVDSEIFLESPQPSLFDVYSESFGKPHLNKRWERAIGLNAQENADQHASIRQSDAKDSSFDTHRRSRGHTDLPRDKKRPPLMYWIGPRGAHLAVERFDRFDGNAWERSGRGDVAVEFATVPFGQKVWFKSPLVPIREQSPYVGAQSVALKTMRYPSPKIPSPFGLQMWHIDKVDQPDFFGLTKDGTLEMPGRLHVPDDTVLRMVATELELSRIEWLASLPRTKLAIDARSDAETQLRQLAKEWTKGVPRGWEQIQSLLTHLKNEFQFARLDASDEEATESLETFVRDAKGSDVLFATAASVMLEELGYASRFVTGFYASPERFEPIKAQTAILPQDVHAWLEVEVGLGYWIPIEATPGFLEPSYRLSLWHRVKYATPIVLLYGSIVALIVAMVWLMRIVLFELACRALWHPVCMLGDRQIAVWLWRILEWRLQFSGRIRPTDRTPRRWIQQLFSPVLNSSYMEPMNAVAARDWSNTTSPGRAAIWAHELQTFFDEADGIWFGTSPAFTETGRAAVASLWQKATTRRLRSTLNNDRTKESK